MPFYQEETQCFMSLQGWLLVCIKISIVKYQCHFTKKRRNALRLYRVFFKEKS